MSNLWIDPNACRSLAVLVESVTAPMLIAHDAPVCLELDIDVDMPVPADANRIADLIRTLAGQALAEMRDGGDLNITACQTAGGVELEIADTGRDVQDRSKSRPLAAAAIGAKVAWQNCPQGGGSVTITFADSSAGQQRRAA